MTSSVPLETGRQILGRAVNAYLNGRPPYPEMLYEYLKKRCEFNTGMKVLEIGPGTGLATSRLLSMHPQTIYAVEPDPVFSHHLRSVFESSTVTVVQSTFEDATLAANEFDVCVAASSFHWLDPELALKQVHDALRPGGWFAMWWTYFQVRTARDSFQLATDHLFVNLPENPGVRKLGLLFANDRDSRVHELRRAGFRNEQTMSWEWTHAFATEKLVDLYRSFSQVQSLEADTREDILRKLTRIVDLNYAGVVERPFVTICYAAQKPDF